MDFKALRVLGTRTVLVLWSAQVLSAVGDQLYALAMAWTAIRLGGSEAGWVMGAQALSILVFGAVGGLFADRWDRRRTMVVADALRAVAVLAVPLLGRWGGLRLWHLGAVGVVVGALTALFDPALQAGLPLLAETPAQLQAATALMDSTKRIARVVGPGLTGVLLAFLPLPHFFSIDAVSFAISAGAVLLLWRALAAPRAQPGATPDARTAFAETWAALRARPALLQGLAGVALGNFTWGLCYVVGLPILVEQVLHAGAGAFGTLVAIFGGASLVGSAVAASVPVRSRRVWVFGGLGAMALGYLLVAHGTSHAHLALGLVVASLGGPLQNLATLRMLQDGMPRAHLGKGYAVFMVGSAAGAALGSATAAALFPRFGVAASMTAACLAMMALSAASLARLAGRRATEMVAT